MGMIYDPSDARKLVEALGSNVTKSQHIMENLQSASNKLLTSIGSGTSMTGATVEAGRGLFSQLVLPTIKKVSEVIEKVSSEKDKLNELIGPAGGEILDEDKLNEQLQEKQQQQTNINSMINMYRMQGSLHSDDSKLSNMYSDFQKQWTGFLGTVEQDIEDINKKLQKLHTFNTGANTLFTDSLNDLKNSMKAVIILGNTSINSKTGTYTLPKGLSLAEVSSFLLGTARDNEIDKVMEISINKLGETISTQMLSKDSSYVGQWSARIGGEVTTGALSSASKAISPVVDFGLNLYDGESWGVAGTHTAVTTTFGVVGTAGAISLIGEVGGLMTASGAALTSSATFAGVGAGLSSMGASSIGMAAALSNPVGWGVVGVIAIGASVAFVGNLAYENNFLGLKDTVNDIGERIENEVKDIGSAFSSGWEQLKLAF